jgi:hypothetical protein
MGLCPADDLGWGDDFIRVELFLATAHRFEFGLHGFLLFGLLRPTNLLDAGVIILHLANQNKSQWEGCGRGYREIGPKRILPFLTRLMEVTAS